METSETKTQCNLCYERDDRDDDDDDDGDDDDDADDDDDDRAVRRFFVHYFQARCLRPAALWTNHVREERLHLRDAGTETFLLLPTTQRQPPHTHTHTHTHIHTHTQTHTPYGDPRRLMNAPPWARLIITLVFLPFLWYICV